jgi:hypothetical protein
MKVTQRFGKGLVSALVATMALGLAASLQAQSVPGKAEVRAIKGKAAYSVGGGPMQPLKVGMVLQSGTTLRTEAESAVDLFLGKSAGVVRMIESTTLALDQLAITDTGADTAVDVQLNLPDGTILGNVGKLSAASKYEIKVPSGVAGIRGTRYRISATSFIVLLNGTLVFVHVPPGQAAKPYTLSAVAGPVYFSPLEGVQQAPQDVVNEVRQQFGQMQPTTPPPPPGPGQRPGDSTTGQDPAVPGDSTPPPPQQDTSPTTPPG